MEYLDVDWKTDQFADLLFGDYLNREDKVWGLYLCGDTRTFHGQ